MSDLISRALLCGMGLASLTKDAVAKTVGELVDQSKISEEEGRKVMKDLLARSAEAEKALEIRIEAAVHKVLKTLEVVPAKAKTAKAAGKKTAKRKAHA